MNLQKTLGVLAILAVLGFSACSKSNVESTTAAVEQKPEQTVAKVEPAKPTPAAPQQAAPAQRRLVKVATIEGAEAFSEFQANVQLVQQQRAQIIVLTKQLEEASDAQQKALIQGQIDTALAKLNENNRKMTQVYGFSLTRNYNLAIEQSSIYLKLTTEEVERIKVAQSTSR